MNFAKQKNSTTILLGIGFIAAGTAYWTITLSEINMISSTFLLRWSLAALLTGLLGGLIIRNPPLKVALLSTLGAELAIIIRVVYDGLFVDSTSHNLWPFEVVLAFIIAFPVMLLGAGIAHLLHKFRKKSSKAFN